MESAVYSLWVIKLENLVKNKLYICKEYHIQPSEIDRMIYHEYEWLLDEIKNIQEKEEKRNKEEQKMYDDMKMPNTNDFTKNMGKNMPNFSNMSLPKISVPKF